MSSNNERKEIKENSTHRDHDHHWVSRGYGGKNLNWVVECSICQTFDTEDMDSQVETLLKKHALKARIEELSGVRLDYEHRQAETFIDNKQQSILGRILTLKAQLESELKGME